MESSTGLTDLFEGVRRRWRIALLVALPLLAGAGVYAQSLPSTYTATAIVALTPRPEVDVGGDIVRVVLPKYVAYVTSRPVSTTVARRLGLDEDDVRNGTDASVAPETANLEIIVEMERPEDAAAVAVALSRVATDLAAVDALLEASVIVPAVEVDEPSGPPRRLIQLAGLLLALVAGVVAALLVESSRPRVLRSADLSAATGHRTLAVLPRRRVLRRPPQEALLDPVVAAVVGALRVQVDSESRLQPFRTLAVASPSSGDGKTTVAAALAVAMGQLELRVLLVDADLRRPRLADHLGHELVGGGLVDVLTGTVPFASVVRKPPDLPGVHVLTTRSHPDPATLLALHLPQLLESAAAEYDVVLLDCPPILATDDALIITRACDATLVVVDRGSSSTRVRAATGELDSLRVRVVGTVLNRGRATGQGSYSYGTYTARSRPRARRAPRT